MGRIRRALISVSDKTGLLELGRFLADRGVEILSTGGTARALREAGVTVRDVADYTGFPEMMDGRVKTLHPKVHGALLCVWDDPEHRRAAEEAGIGPIDLVVVNLYPFRETVAKPNVPVEEAVENIDIGGPTMLRSAAKNCAYVTVVCNPKRYSDIIAAIETKGEVPGQLRRRLAFEAFAHTRDYDTAIADYLNSVWG